MRSCLQKKLELTENDLTPFPIDENGYLKMENSDVTKKGFMDDGKVKSSRPSLQPT